MFYFFIEISQKFCAENGLTNYIIPDRLLLNTQCANIRTDLLLNQNIKEIIAFSDQVFSSAVVDSIILLYQNCKNNSQKILAANKVTLENIKTINRIEIPYDHILNSPNSQLDINYNKEISNLIDKIRENTLEYGEVCNIKDGIIQSKVPDVLFLKEPENDHCRKLLFGRDIKRFKIDWSGNWVHYDIQLMKNIEATRGGNGLRMRVPELFETKKILTRQTSDSIIATFDEGENYYYSNTLHGARIMNSDFDAYFILGILNSKLITFYYRTITAEEGKVFAQVKIELLKLLPIKNTSEQDLIIEFSKMLTTADEIKYDEVYNKLNAEVYKLYDLNSDEINIVESTFIDK